MSSGRPRGRVFVLRELLQRHVDAGTLAGAVARVDDEVAVVGDRTLGGEPMTADTVFRWASITKPLTSALTMTFVQDGTVALEDAADRWLPELHGLRVLRHPDAALDDTVPLAEPLTIRHLLDSTCGWGFPSTFDSDWVEGLFRWQTGLEITTVPEPDAWLAGLAGLPLRDQPGRQWLYNTAYDVLGVLLARVAGRAFPDVLAERLTGPLGMADCGFSVRPDQRDRFCAAYRLGADGLELFDDLDGRWSAPPRFPSGAGGLVGTLDDWDRFAAELLGGGRVLTPESLRAMTTDHLDESSRRAGELFLDGEGWGFGGTVHPTSGRYGWSGGTGTSAHVVPATGRVGILMAQTVLDSPVPPTLLQEFWDYAF
jgi:CubicO group peptidase (beta-lactamase class C family)